MTNKVSTLRSDIRTIEAPELLKQKQAWLLWRFEDRGRGKPDKIPYYANGQKRFEQQGSELDLEKLATFEAAKAAAAKRGFDGIGFATLPQFGIVALDFDYCVDAKGIHPEVASIIEGTYSEFSPSGKGIRAFFQGEMPANRKSYIDDGPGIEYGFEVFHSKLFVTFTGNVTEACALVGWDDTVAPINDRVMALYDQRFPEAVFSAHNDNPIGLTYEDARTILEALPEEMSYDLWIRVGMSMHHEFKGDYEAFELFNDFSARSLKDSGRDYNMRKWDSFGHYTGNDCTGRYLVRIGAKHGVVLSMFEIGEHEFDSLVVPDEEESEPWVGNDSIENDFADVVPIETAKAEKSDPVPKTQYKFPVIPAHQFVQGKTIQWHIKHLLPKQGFTVLFGESGTGKSFVTIDLTMAVARGVDNWRGKRVKKGRVVYIVAEGQGGFRARLNAYADRFGFDLADLDYGLIEVPPNLLHQPDVVELCRSIGEEGTRRCDLLVIDTLAQTTPGGNENSSEDMGLVIANCQKMMQVLKTSVVLVHHAGKDTTKGARGWSGIRGASDCQIEVTGDGQGNTVAKVVKLKEWSGGEMFGYHLEPVPLGVDEDGDEIATCVAVESEIKVASKESRMGAEQQLYYQAFQDLLLIHGEAGVPMECWDDRIRELKKAKLSESGELELLNPEQVRNRIRVNKKPKNAFFEGENPILRVQDDHVFEN